MGMMNTNGVAAATKESHPMVNGSFTILQSYMESKEVSETKEIAAELSRYFYTLSWFLGTGGSITIKVHDVSISRQNQIIVMSPSGKCLYIYTCLGTRPQSVTRLTPNAF